MLSHFQFFLIFCFSKIIELFLVLLVKNQNKMAGRPDVNQQVDYAQLFFFLKIELKRL